MESYFYVLQALPTLRHEGPHLGQAVAQLAHAINTVRTKLPRVLDITKEFERAAQFVDTMQADKNAQFVSSLSGALDSLCRKIEDRHPGKLVCRLGAVQHSGIVHVPSGILESILTCLTDNAVDTIEDSGQPSVNVEIDVQLREVPEGRQKRAKRALVRVRNDGPAITGELAPFLFAERVSLHHAPGGNMGTGLSTARTQARAYGGDVVLLSQKPVTFGIVLDIGTGDDDSGRQP